MSDCTAVDSLLPCREHALPDRCPPIVTAAASTCADGSHLSTATSAPAATQALRKALTDDDARRRCTTR